MNGHLAHPWTITPHYNPTFSLSLSSARSQLSSSLSQSQKHTSITTGPQPCSPSVQPKNVESNPFRSETIALELAHAGSHICATRLFSSSSSSDPILLLSTGSLIPLSLSLQISLFLFWFIWVCKPYQSFCLS